MRVQLTGSFTLAAPLDRVMPLFTAEGERAWAPGWEPTYADRDVHEVGQVWTTAGPPLTTWVTVQADETAVRYARVAEGESAGIVTVSCAPTDAGTEVTVSYDLSALSPAGAERLPQFASSYEQMLEHWRQHTSQALAPSPFVPSDFEVPVAFAAAGFRLEPLGPQHNERDYAAWMSSIDHIRSSPGYPDGSWPHEMSLNENRADLERHARHFADRKGFTYTVLDDKDDVVGCVYIYPAKNGVHDASVQSWVRQSEAASDAIFRRAIADWLTSDAWPFARPLYEPLLG